MKTKAAICWKPMSDWSVEEIELDAPKEGEVLVKNVGSGLCHSDEHLLRGDIRLPEAAEQQYGIKQYPLIGGHEGAGEVLEVGPGVTTVQPGDHVVFSFIPACGRCPSCAQGRQQLCDMGAFILAGRQVTDQTARHHAQDGTDIGAMSAIATFCPYTVTSEASVIKILPDIPLDKAALVGCGVPTGWGSATYAADVQPGETVVIVGLGGVGANAVQGAAMAGAQYIVAIDPNEWKHEAIKAFGATHTASSMEEATELVGQLTWGMMADKTILTVGEATGDLIQPLLNLTKKGGRAVVTAAGSLFRHDVTMNLCELTMSRKELVGTCYGNCNPRYDIPRLLRLYMEGQLKLDELISKTYTLEDINTGYDDMRNGRNFRGMLMY